jgi:hypothetical protein
MCAYAYHRRCEVPDKVEDTADVDLESVPPRMRVFVVQHFETKTKKKKKEAERVSDLHSP